MSNKSTSSRLISYFGKITKQDYDDMNAMFKCSYSFGYRLKYLRQLRGMTQKQLGIACGFPESSASVRIRQYESDSAYPREDILIKFAEALSVSKETLIQLDEVPFGDVFVQVLRWAEEWGFISFSDFNKKNEVSFSIDNVFLRSAFADWKDIKEKLNNKELSKDEYQQWLLDFDARDEV